MAPPVVKTASPVDSASSVLAALGAEVAPVRLEAQAQHLQHVQHLHQHESARWADGVLWRRTKPGLHGCAAQRSQVARGRESQRAPARARAARSVVAEAAWI